jgi:DedD protein
MGPEAAGERAEGALAQDDYYYEIQLTNKQLVFYFLAGATALILSFLAGIWVGRGVDARATETRVAREEPVVPVGEDPQVKTSPVPAEGYSYSQRLEADRPADALETPEARTARAASTTPTPAVKPTPTPVKSPAKASTTPSPAVVPAPPAATPKPGKTPALTPTPRVAEAAAKPTPTPKAATTHPGGAAQPQPQPAAGSLTIQVGAFRERERADGVVAQLKKKGYPARVAAPAGEKGGLFNVTVGPYKTRAEADRVMTRLAQQERFKPFLVHQ